MAPAEDVVRSQRDRHLAALRPLIAGHRRVALIGFPNHGNVGDSAIWLGELELLRALEVDLVYVSDTDAYDEAALRRRIGDGVILFHGGGNLGDLWPRHQPLREAVVSAFGTNAVVLLPQSIHFRDPANAERASAVFGRHERLAVTVRDETSLRIGSELFGADRTTLCPDSAVRAPVPSSSSRAVHDIVFLARRDHEVAHPPDAMPLQDVHVTDWVTDLPWTQEFLQLKGAAQTHEEREAAYRRQAEAVVRSGLDVLAGGRVILTDRLHAHLLCLLMQLPHVLLDNSYGKVRSYYEAWTAPSDLVRWADDVDEGLRSARQLVEAPT